MQIVKISESPELLQTAAKWFSEKWRVSLSAYVESMEASLTAASVPQWYVVIHGDRIIGGLGIIENDFHCRKDLTPNVCAVYVDELYRCQGIAGNLLETVCSDMSAKGIDTLYLLTDHTSFYERYGWEFFCMVQGDGEDEMSRMYIHRTERN